MLLVVDLADVQQHQIGVVEHPIEQLVVVTRTKPLVSRQVWIPALRANSSAWNSCCSMALPEAVTPPPGLFSGSSWWGLHQLRAR